VSGKAGAPLLTKQIVNQELFQQSIKEIRIPQSSTEKNSPANSFENSGKKDLGCL